MGESPFSLGVAIGRLSMPQWMASHPHGLLEHELDSVRSLFKERERTRERNVAEGSGRAGGRSEDVYDQNTLYACTEFSKKFFLTRGEKRTTS